MTNQEKATILPTNLRPAQAAKYLGISISKLAKLRMVRHRHLGPRFVKVAGCVVYRREDLDSWLQANIVDPLSDKCPASQTDHENDH